MWLVPNRAISPLSAASNVPFDDVPEWDAGAAYPLGERVQRYRMIYQSALAGNIGVDPSLVNQDLTAPEWILDGAINALKCLDGVLANKTKVSRGNPISSEYVSFGVDPDLTAYVLDIPVMTGETTLTLFGLSAKRVRIIAINDAGQKVFEQVRVVGGRWVTNYWQYFTVPLGAWRRIQVFRTLPLSSVRVLICLEGDEVSLGEVTIGRELYIGETLIDNTTAEHRTASRFEINEFGTARYVKGPTRRDVNYSVSVARSAFEQIEGLIADMTGGLVTGIGSVDRPTNISCGIMGEIGWSEYDPDFYTVQFTIKGVS